MRSLQGVLLICYFSGIFSNPRRSSKFFTDSSSSSSLSSDQPDSSPPEPLYSFHYEGLTAQNIISGCEGVKYSDGSISKEFYVVDATGTKKFIKPGSAATIAFPANLVVPSAIVTTAVNFKEMCFPKQCEAGVCGTIVGPMSTFGTAQSMQTSNFPTSANFFNQFFGQMPKNESAAPSKSSEAPSGSDSSKSRNEIYSDETATNPDADIERKSLKGRAKPGRIPAENVPRCSEDSSSCQQSTTTVTQVSQGRLCPPPPPTIVVPPPAPQCNCVCNCEAEKKPSVEISKEISEFFPSAFISGSRSSSASLLKQRNDAAYYASLPGAIRGHTGVVYYPSCERDAFHQVAIMPFCDHRRSARVLEEHEDEVRSLSTLVAARGRNNSETAGESLGRENTN